MKSSIVLGAGFGDEGKGLTTSYLCSKTDKPLVVRFSGGHQAGHTVVFNAHRHVFSNFGSGTLQEVPTFWSRFCTFNPIAVLNEFNALRSFHPMLYVDPLCPVTTPFDRIYNTLTEKVNNHGSCGVGFGATMARHESYYRLYVRDLFYSSILRAKLDNIIQYYEKTMPRDHFFMPIAYEEIREQFIKQVEQVIEIIHTSINFSKYDHIIFEGSQGILLDMDFGFFPNVTRSNTTSKNAHQLLQEMGRPSGPAADVYYVTRSYQTRHGAGFMTNENLPPTLINNEKETNVTNQYQGEFRKGTLDLDLLHYALSYDREFSAHCCKHLVVTCLDQTGEDFPVTIGGNLHTTDALALGKWLGIESEYVIGSRGPNSLLDQSCIEMATQPA